MKLEEVGKKLRRAAPAELALKAWRGHPSRLSLDGQLNFAALS
jgi:hypothetical protein